MMSIIVIKGESMILTWSVDSTARFWDIQWAMGDTNDPKFVHDLHREKLVGAPPPTPWDTLKSLLWPSSTQSR
ncbi:MAG: hypothetical protein ACI8ZB_002747 [Desulforhopalus sp.]|jgi:hypothetical protein